jgi:hypothetical protein
MVLPLAVAGGFFAGPIAAFATSRAVVPVPEHRVAHVISVVPFARASDETCTPDPLRVGPHEHSGRLLLVSSLAERMQAAAARCLDAEPTSLTLSVAVDAHGNIGDVEAATPSDAVATCSVREVRAGGPVETRGPGWLRVGYFLGHS